MSRDDIMPSPSVQTMREISFYFHRRRSFVLTNRDFRLDSSENICTRQQAREPRESFSEGNETATEIVNNKCLLPLCRRGSPSLSNKQ